MNARNVEHVVAELSDHPLQEIRDLGAAIASAVGNLAPSLVKHTVRGSYPRQNRDQLSKLFGTIASSDSEPIATAPTVRFVDATPDGEAKILRALKFSCSLDHCGTANAKDVNIVWKEALRNLGPHDSVLREFEVATMTFEADVSASCFAQLKRHRMMTLLAQPYNPEAGIILPPSIEVAGLRNTFEAAVEVARSAARKANESFPLLAPYLLTNSHRKRVLIHANARELYHFARLRCDAHAQWEIRSLGDQVMQIAREKWPHVFALACGKDQFEQMYAAFLAH